MKGEKKKIESGPFNVTTPVSLQEEEEKKRELDEFRPFSRGIFHEEVDTKAKENVILHI